MDKEEGQTTEIVCPSGVPESVIRWLTQLITTTGRFRSRLLSSGDRELGIKFVLKIRVRLGSRQSKIDGD